MNTSGKVDPSLKWTMVPQDWPLHYTGLYKIERMKKGWGGGGVGGKVDVTVPLPTEKHPK